jgi:hypothetical protein
MLPALLAFALHSWQRGIAAPSSTRPSSFVTRHSSFVISGVFLAATLWTYMAARATWTLFIIAPVLVLLSDHERFRRHWPGMILTLAIGGLLAAPMFLWLQAHPGAEQRLGQLGEPLRLLASGNPGEIVENSIEALGMFTFRADTLWLYNIPGRPWLDPATGVLFYAGILLALWNWRKPAYLLSLAWLAVGTFPSLMTGLSASGTRAVAVQPVLYLFPALALVKLGHWLRSRVILRIPYRRGGIPEARSSYHFLSSDPSASLRADAKNLYFASQRLFVTSVWLAAAALVIVTGALGFRDYFITWANARDVRVAYHTTLFEMARYLDAQPNGGTVALSSITPGRFHDPYSMGMLLHRHDLALRWFDGRNALALPPTGSRLIVQAISPIDPALSSLVSQGARLIESRTLRPNDLNPHFDVFDWQDASSVTLLKPDGPADLGRTIELIGYSINATTIKPTDELTILTFWRVRSTTDPDRETMLFTHLLATPSGPLLAGQDLIGYPSWQWQPGDEFIQVHRFLIPPNTAPGQYPIEIGAYTREIPSAVQPNPPTTRLTVYDGDKATGDRVLLPSVTVISNQ